MFEKLSIQNKILLLDILILIIAIMEICRILYFQTSNMLKLNDKSFNILITEIFSYKNNLENKGKFMQNPFSFPKMEKILLCYDSII